MVRFARGEMHLIDSVAPDNFERLAAEAPSAVSDIGPGLESELLWFNQAPGAPLPESKKVWFRSAAFRRAVLQAINRDDLCRLVYHGHASPAVGPISPAKPPLVQHRFEAGAIRPPGRFADSGARRL